jgi:hypothetical protein
MEFITNLTTPKGVFVEFAISRMHGKGRGYVLVLSCRVMSFNWDAKLTAFAEEMDKEVVMADTPFNLGVLINRARQEAERLTRRGLKGQWREGDAAYKARREPIKVDHVALLLEALNSK